MSEKTCCSEWVRNKQANKQQSTYYIIYHPEDLDDTPHPFLQSLVASNAKPVTQDIIHHIHLEEAEGPQEVNQLEGMLLVELQVVIKNISRNS